VAIWDVEVQRHPEIITHSRLPLVLGTDGAGVVVTLGSQVHSFKVGDRVYGGGWDDPHGGFYAEYVAVPEDRLGHLPPGLSLSDAAAIYATGATALQGLDDTLQLKSGQTLIIHGAAGGVGSMAIQFAKQRGARVLATASGEDSLAFVKKLGADAAVDGRQGDIAASARQFAPAGVDAVLGLAGGEALERCIDSVRPAGRVAFPYGVQPRPKARTGVSVVGYDLTYGAEAFERFNRAVGAARLQIPIAAEYPLAEAQQAHERQAAGHVLGKILLRVR